MNLQESAMIDLEPRFHSRFPLGRALFCLGLTCLSVGCLCGRADKPKADAGAAPSTKATPTPPPRAGSWHDVTVSSKEADPVPIAPPMGYVHQDGASAVVYSTITPSGQRSIVEFVEKGNGWRKVDVCTSSGAACSPWGEVSAYVRGDGVNSILYAGMMGRQRHLRELTWDGGRQRWNDNDLSAVAKGPLVDGLPFGYVRADKSTSVVYCQSNGDVRETYLSNGKWFDASLRDVAKGGQLADCDVCGPVGVGASNGQSMVIYLGIDQRIHALRIAGSSWHHHDLSADSRSSFNALPCPTAYLRGDGVVSVLYKVATPAGIKLREMTGDAKGNNWSWTDWDYSGSVTPAPPLVEDCLGALCNPGNAYGYVHEGVSRVVYLSKGGKIQEASLRAGRGWVLTVPSPSDGAGVEGALYPRPYLRRDGSPAIVYRSSDGSVHELEY